MAFGGSAHLSCDVNFFCSWGTEACVHPSHSLTYIYPTGLFFSYFFFSSLWADSVFGFGGAIFGAVQATVEGVAWCALELFALPVSKYLGETMHYYNTLAGDTCSRPWISFCCSWLCHGLWPAIFTSWSLAGRRVRQGPRGCR